MDFIVAYPPEFTKTVAMLVKMGLASQSPFKVRESMVKPQDVLIAVVDSTPKTEPELDADVQRIELYGEVDGRSTTLKYDAITAPSEKWKIGGGTVDTGVPPSIAAQLLAKRDKDQRCGSTRLVHRSPSLLQRVEPTRNKSLRTL